MNSLNNKNNKLFKWKMVKSIQRTPKQGTESSKGCSGSGNKKLTQ